MNLKRWFRIKSSISLVLSSPNSSTSSLSSDCNLISSTIHMYEYTMLCFFARSGNGSFLIATALIVAFVIFVRRPSTHLLTERNKSNTNVLNAYVSVDNSRCWHQITHYYAESTGRPCVHNHFSCFVLFPRASGVFIRRNARNKEISFRFTRHALRCSFAYNFETNRWKFVNF